MLGRGEWRRGRRGKDNRAEGRGKMKKRKKKYNFSNFV